MPGPTSDLKNKKAIPFLIVLHPIASYFVPVSYSITACMCKNLACKNVGRAC